MASHSVWFRSGGLGAGATALVATQQLSNYANVLIGRGITRPGTLTFDVYGLDTGSPDPAPGDYIEVRFGETPATDPVVWSGIIRQAAEDRHDPDTWHIVAADPLNEIHRRELAARATSTTNERTAVIAVLTDLGITTGSAPIRYQAASILAGGAGTALTTYRREYDNGLKLLRQLCLTFGREVTVKRESNGAGGFVWTVYYETQAGGAAASATQATWRANSNAGRMFDITDDWDKKDAVTVLGQGDGSEAIAQTSGAGGASSPRAAVPMKSIADSAVATAAAATLQSAFGSNRRVIVVSPDVADPSEDPAGADGPVDLGYKVELQDDDGVTVGTGWRVVYLETAPDGREDENGDTWYVRATLLGSTSLVLPSITEAGGMRPGGLADVVDLGVQHERYKQITDYPPTTLETDADDISASTGVGVALAAGANNVEIATQTSIPADFGKADGFLINVSVAANARTVGVGPSHTHTLSNHGHAMAGHTHNAPGGGGVTDGPTPADTTGPVPDVTGAGGTGAISLEGPFVLQVILRFNGLPVDVTLMLITLPHLPEAGQFVTTQVAYPFAVSDGAGDYLPDSLRMRMSNLGPRAVTISAGTQVNVYKVPLRRLNA